MLLDDFYEELPTDAPVDEPTPDTPEEPKEIKGHILSAEEMEEWKNGGTATDVLRRAADVKPEDEPKDPDKPAEPKDEPKEPVTAEATPAPQPQAVDPGEYAPADYSFDVTVYDTEGKNPKQISIASVEQFDELLEKDSNFGSYAALAKAQRAADKMESNQERDYAAWESAKAEFEADQESLQSRVTTLNHIAAGMDYLVSKGKLPAVSTELKEANWNDPEIAAQPGVKEQLALLKYMDTETVARRKLGLPDLNDPIAALAQMRQEEAERGQVDTAKRQADARKAAGAKVGGTSPAPATSAPKGIAVGRVSPGGLRDMGSRF